MSRLPLVSVITPSYNQGQFLEETILSVLNQTYKNIEYIVIDGGSTDKSIEVIKKYGNKIAYWISEKDRGQADAINKGFKKATGDYICWLNSDDIFYPDFIERRIKDFVKHPDADLIYGDVDQGVDLHSKTLRKGRTTGFTEMLRTIDVPIPQQSAMWKRSVIQKIGLLDENYHVLLDREYFMRIAMTCSIKYIPGPAGFFRNHDQSKSIAEAMAWTDEMPAYYKYLFETSLPEQFRKYKKECLTSMYLFCAGVASESGSPKFAGFLRDAKRMSRKYYFLYRYIKPLRSRLFKIFSKNEPGSGS